MLRRVGRYGVVLTGVVGAVVAFVYGIAMPVRALPEPDGPFAVGTIVYELVDEARPERYAETVPAPPRRLRVQLWYPAGRAAGPGNGSSSGDSRDYGEVVPWMPDGRPQVRAIVRHHGFPAFIWDHTVFMRSTSYWGVSPGGEADAPMPVVLISHGWEGYRALHADVAEELASRGFLVIAPEHTYGAAAVVFADGDRITASTAVLPERGTDGFPEAATTLVQTFSADGAFLLDHLERVHAGRADVATDDPAVDGALRALAGQVDTTRVAAIGHSTGGGAMVHLAMTDTRVDAVLGLDAWVEPLDGTGLLDAAVAREAGERVPMLFLRSAAWEGGINDAYLLPFVSALVAGSEDESDATGNGRRPTDPVLFHLDGATHEQFSTLYMYRPAVRWMGLLGTVDAEGFSRFQREVAATFAAHHLTGGPAPDLTGTAGTPQFVSPVPLGSPAR